MTRFLFPFVLALLSARVAAAGEAVFTEILSRPTDTSVTLSVLFDRVVECSIAYGTTPELASRATPLRLSAPGEPVLEVLDGLLPDTRYYYRTRYRDPGDTAFHVGPERTFHTRRPPGSAFSFTIEADAHPYDKKGSHALLETTLRNQLADSADFLIDLGDTFGDDHNPETITAEEIRQLRYAWRLRFGAVCHSAALFLCLGNHEGESGYYLLQNPPDNMAVNATRWRTFYFPNPVPGSFYSGNAEVEGFGIGPPQNYYAWEWGDALFVVLDAYRYCAADAKPRGWDWTIGKAQYDWFRSTLESSRARFKFVFAHHTLGQTRGGVMTARYYEWGGYEGNGVTWGFDANRPGWGLPIHQVMVANGVTIYFQGHDHLYATEVLEGVVYQEVPMPSDSTYVIGVTENASAYTGVTLDGSGHLRVTVLPDSVTVAYVESRLPADEGTAHWNRRVVTSYTVGPKLPSAMRQEELPLVPSLEQNYPNPFNPVTVIPFSLPEHGGAVLRVFDLLGREVASLLRGELEAGRHSVEWNASGVPSGVYFYRLEAAGRVETRKAIVLR